MRTFLYMHVGGFLGGSVAKNPPANAGAAGDVSLIPGSGRFPGGRDPMDRKAW